MPPESTHLNKMAINNYYESQGMFQAFKYAEHLMYISYSAPADLLTHGLQDVDRVTEEQGMRAGFQYMNSGFEEEDLIAQGQMARPTRTP